MGRLDTRGVVRARNLGADVPRSLLDCISSAQGPAQWPDLAARAAQAPVENLQALTLLPVLPDVPTMNESGFSDFDDLTWFAFFAPAGTPPAVVARLNAEINKAMAAPAVVAKIAEPGLTARRNTPAGCAAYLSSEIPKRAKAVKDSGVKAG